MEQWETIPEFPIYEVSTEGRIRNVETGHLLALRPNQRGVVYVGMQLSPGSQVVRAVAPLVAQAFCLPPVSSWDTVIHLNGNAADNRASNLEYRERWFAIQYQRQFSEQPYSRRIYDAVRCDTCGVVYDDSFAAAVTHGLMERGIVLNCVGVTDGVPPLWHRFSLADTSSA